ncbi:LacI family DNA-binding transcriptional regulator [Paenibacillus sp. BSR1-1]|uniref:LacI family DNA-binding transcriptional regulator n=1 Tax=Paenibacillus sp. BSR1-1 TaxID=3020845 RepID=UPI0025B158D5|nr:LacI family DNA-binding transcriptional regulator [Paenibacillus sp. BSR1-1]MDN3017518.1 LacI family DNA-binding transcriptional regulator [Paenibacillus sp. BSR1-1]
MTKTIADIAKIAGVAKSTVSRYLNGGSVSDATKKKIELVINETGYIPNTFAQSLKAKKTNIIGTIVPRLDSYAASNTLIGIDEHLRDQGFQMLIANTNQDLEREIESIYSFERQKIAGIILLATVITEAHLEALASVQIPVILVGQQDEHTYSLIHDDFSAGYDLATYILNKGHRKIAYLGVTEADISVGVKRKTGFTTAIENYPECEVHYYESGFKIKDAMGVALKILSECKPTILFCATDNIALGALKAAYIKGLKVPEDISIVGFGGYEITEVIHPALTTAKFYYKEAGQLAAQNIVRLVNGEKVEKLTISKYEIIERESVDKLN